ncbi:hypothetical protein [Phytobacter massiliensis]|uniref:hypothetical protein n=1 Tax=Phytobacter massiliensis TaxID=1485952 RepID=UPI00030BC71A|nr:hypothetical protein [Phytobacter massiliensis]
MAVSARTDAGKRLCQRHDAPQKAKPQAATSVPASWKLTPQQQAFIDAFAEDEAAKQ